MGLHLGRSGDVTPDPCALHNFVGDRLVFASCSVRIIALNLGVKMPAVTSIALLPCSRVCCWCAPSAADSRLWACGAFLGCPHHIWNVILSRFACRFQSSSVHVAVTRSRRRGSVDGNSLYACLDLSHFK